MKWKEWDRQRRGTLQAWKYQLLSRETTIQEQLGKWTYAVTMRGDLYIAHILVKSFEYYDRRLHLRRDERPITLIICQQHTTYVPVHVEALSFLSGPGSYEPYQLPAASIPEKRGTVLAKQILLGQLISGAISIDEGLADVAPSTRSIYLTRLKQLLKPARGRAPSL
jgi:hypothetical protein